LPRGYEEDASSKEKKGKAAEGMILGIRKELKKKKGREERWKV